jgi:hypothetical protein
MEVCETCRRNRKRESALRGRRSARGGVEERMRREKEVGGAESVADI